MQLSIENKQKLEIFVALFQLLKNWGSALTIYFKPDKLYIQTMDNSHICLAYIEIKDNWFSTYQCTSELTSISINSTQFAVLINYALKHDKLELKCENDSDKLFVSFTNKELFDHFFELNLIDIETANIEIPSVDYDVDFTIETKKFIDLLAELNTFGNVLNINCNENVFELNTSGDETKLKINIPVNDLNEYGITENGKLDISFSLNHICKLCVSPKLASEINVSISDNYPMSIKYNLGEESMIYFYIAPKIED
jgi:proliferating cell nuclear antigen